MFFLETSTLLFFFWNTGTPHAHTPSPGRTQTAPMQYGGQRCRAIRLPEDHGRTTVCVAAPVDLFYEKSRADNLARGSYVLLPMKFVKTIDQMGQEQTHWIGMDWRVGKGRIIENAILFDEKSHHLFCGTRDRSSATKSRAKDFIRISLWSPEKWSGCSPCASKRDLASVSNVKRPFPCSKKIAYVFFSLTASVEAVQTQHIGTRLRVRMGKGVLSMLLHVYAKEPEVALQNCTKA